MSDTVKFRRPVECLAVVHLGSQQFECDCYGGHEGRHGGVYPGNIDGQTIDVEVKW